VDGNGSRNSRGAIQNLAVHVVNCVPGPPQARVSHEVGELQPVDPKHEQRQLTAVSPFAGVEADE